MAPFAWDQRRCETFVSRAVLRTGRGGGTGWRGLPACHAQGWVTAMMPYAEYSDCFADDAKEEVIGETPKVGAANVGLSDREGCGPLDGLFDEVAKLLIEGIAEFWGGDAFVVRHDLD